MARYLIGIDLGTTNSALAYVDAQRPARAGRIDIKPFPIPQLVAPGEVKDRPLLPSFLYLPGGHDLPAGATALPWDAGRGFAVGEFARNHGGRIPGRLVSSAKFRPSRRRPATCATWSRRGITSWPRTGPTTGWRSSPSS
jgi:molecular chaperone DnaK (HSP70)